MEHKDHCCCPNCGETFENQIQRQHHEKLHSTQQGVSATASSGANPALATTSPAPRKDREFTRSLKE